MDPRDDKRFNAIEPPQYSGSGLPAARRQPPAEVLFVERPRRAGTTESTFADPPIQRAPVGAPAAALPVRRSSRVYAQVEDLVLERERNALEAASEAAPAEEAASLKAASLTIRRELGEANSRLYLEQKRAYETDFIAGRASTKDELDRQQAARDTASKPRRGPPEGYLSPRQLHLLSPRFGHGDDPWRPPSFCGVDFSIAPSDSKFLMSLPPDSPRRLAPMPRSRASVEASVASDRLWGPRWLPSGSVTRLMLPGAAGSQEHMYAKKSPRGLMPSLNARDPVLYAAKLMAADGMLR